MEIAILCCLQIIYASDLVREANQDAEAQQETAPSIGKTEAAQLFRLSMNAAALLRNASDERIDQLNRFGDA